MESNDRELIEAINFRMQKSSDNVLEDIYVEIKTTKRTFEFKKNMKLLKDFISNNVKILRSFKFNLDILKDTYRKKLIGMRLYDYIIDENEITFYSDRGNFTLCNVDQIILK